MRDSDSEKEVPKGRHRSWYRIEQRKRRLRKWTAIGFVGLLPAAGLLGYAGYKFSLKWKEWTALRQAKSFFVQGDFHRALPRLQEALQLNPENPEACRYLAAVYDRTNLTEALIWRQRLNQMEPGKPANLMAIADTALRLGDWGAADQALSEVDEKSRRTVAFHQLAAGAALAGERPLSEVEFHYAQAIQLDPANETNQLHLAKIQLRSGDADSKQKARQVLEALKNKPAFERAALRGLVEGLRQDGLDSNVVEMAQALASRSQATLADRLLLLEVLQSRPEAEFTSYLNQLLEQSSARPDTIAELLSWMNQHGLAAQASEWFKTLPPVVQDQESIYVAVAESLDLSKDWDALYDWVNKKGWKDKEFLRLAFSARTQRQRNDTVEASDKWRLARHAAHGNTQGLLHLANLADTWGWEPEAEELWWIVAEGKLNQRQALTKLQRLYRTQNDTHGLQRVAKALYELAPSDPSAINDFALLSLLTSKDTSLANRLAQDVWARETNKPALLMTYAYSLHTQGRDDEAFRLLSSLSEKQLAEGKLSLYYGLVLTATGQKEMARNYFEIAEKRSDLFPEEKNLILQNPRPRNPIVRPETNQSQRR